jgi:superfamily II DNA or RNA helicase
MSKIIILKDRKHCQIVGETDIEFLQKLDHYLSFKQPGIEYTALYRGYWNGSKFMQWDGVTKLMSSKAVFPIGLLKRVKEFYRGEGKTYDLIDNGEAISVCTPIDLTKNLNKINITPFQYQLDCVVAAQNNHYGIIKAATASGKTLIAALITAALGKSTNIYVIGTSLLYQFHEFFSKVFDEPIGIIGDSVCKVERINIISIWTAGKILGLKKQDILSADDDSDLSDEDIAEKDKESILKAMKYAKVAFFDECHVVGNATCIKINKFIECEHIYGLSGTPYKGDDGDIVIESVFGEPIVNITASFLISQGLLPTPIIKIINVPATILAESSYPSVYKEYIVENHVRNNIILHQTKELVSKGYQVLVLFKTIKHGKILHELFSDAGVKCDILWGKDNIKKRDEVKQRALNHEIDVIVGSTIYDIGVDVPSISALVLASGGKSKVRYYQRIGRALRRYGGKTHVAIIDFYDNAKYLKNHSKQRIALAKLEPKFKLIVPSGLK